MPRYRVNVEFFLDGVDDTDAIEEMIERLRVAFPVTSMIEWVVDQPIPINEEN